MHMEALHFREWRSAESEQEGAGAVGGEEGPPGVFCQLVVFPAPWAEGCSGAQLPHAHGDWQADLPGLQRDLREVAPTGPGLGLDKSVMLGYLWIQYPMCLDIIPPNLFKTKLDRGRRLPFEKRESHTGPKPATGQLDRCSLEASERAAGAGREVGTGQRLSAPGEET